MDVLHLPFSTTPEALASAIGPESVPNFVHIDHTLFLQGAPRDNLIQLGRKHLHAKGLLLALANRGYHCYTLREGVTSLVHFRRIRTLWNKVVDGTFSISADGVVYSLTPAQIQSDHCNLLVIFSSISGNMYSASLMRHFEQNFATVQKYIPHNVAILRIADLGGVIGSYYFDTWAIPDMETRIQALIREVAGTLGVAPASVVTYGGSKGGTAALYHGLLAGSRIVAVDPILDDALYVQRYGDLHYTAEIFPVPVREKFHSVCADPGRAAPGVAVVCSERSPQFSYITTTMGEAFNRRVAFFNSRHPGIRQHPDVSRNTISLAVTLINMMLYGMPPEPGMRAVV